MRSQITIALAAAAGCSSDPGPCLGNWVTIEQGVFGILHEDCELHGCRVRRDVMVAAFAPSPAGEMPPTGAAIAVATTDDEGFYQLALDEGNVDLCYKVNVFDCVRISVSDAPVRWDVVSGNLGGTMWAELACTTE